MNPQGPISTIEDIIRVHAAVRGDRPVTTFDGSAITFAEMDRRSSRIANALVAAGIRPDDRVAIIDKNGPALFETLFAARKVGAVQLAINWRLSPDEIAFIIADSGARLIFAGPDYVAMIEQLPCQDLRIISLGDGTPRSQALANWIEPHGHVDGGRRSAPDDVALQLYTSGTTGRPKGAMLMNRSLFAFIDAATAIFGVDPDARHLDCLPLFHVGGLNWALLAMAQGAQCIGFREFDAATIVRAIERERATHLMTVPAVIQMLLDRPEASSTDFSSLKAIIYGGSTISERVLKAALATFGCDFYGMYGSTELSFGTTLLAPTDHDFARFPDLLASCGRIFDGSELRIVDPQSLAPLPDGTAGELWIRSPQRAVGYWRLPEATAKVFLEDGWYRTGDIGTVRDGYLFLTDRLNDMVVSGGENIYPAEVERVAGEHPDVVEAAAFGIPDPQWGETIVAAVRLRDGATMTQAALIEFMRARLAHFKCPRAILFMEDFPRTASGKVQRQLLRAPYWHGREKRIS